MRAMSSVKKYFWWSLGRELIALLAPLCIAFNLLYEIRSFKFKDLKSSFRRAFTSMTLHSEENSFATIMSISDPLILKFLSFMVQKLLRYNFSIKFSPNLPISWLFNLAELGKKASVSMNSSKQFILDKSRGQTLIQPFICIYFPFKIVRIGSKFFR